MPLYAAGQRIRGSEINALPALYRVSTPQGTGAAGSTALRDIAGLAFSAEINGLYLVECFLAYHATAGRGYQVRVGGTGRHGAG